MTDLTFFFAAYAIPTGIIVWATRRALRQIVEQYARADEATR